MEQNGADLKPVQLVRPRTCQPVPSKSQSTPTEHELQCQPTKLLRKPLCVVNTAPIAAHTACSTTAERASSDSRSRQQWSQRRRERGLLGLHQWHPAVKGSSCAGRRSEFRTAMGEQHPPAVGRWQWKDKGRRASSISVSTCRPVSFHCLVLSSRIFARTGNHEPTGTYFVPYPV
jgi:hypothetical protein